MLAVWLVCWLFSCACMCLLPGLWVVGVGAFWVGYKAFLCCCLWWGQASTLSGSRSTPCERPLPVWVVVARTTSLKGVVRLGVGCVWWVVCDLYSGCEHICSVLFFVFCLVLLASRYMQ